MAKAVLIGGISGSGKSASIENLLPESTFIIKSYNKDFPFRGNNYVSLTKDNPSGNLLVTDKTAVTISTLNYINAQRPEIKVVVLEDFQFVSSFEFMRRSKEIGLILWLN